jgi:MFS family permease
VTLVFFTTYVVFQPPSTVIVRKIGPRIHLSTITLLWGAVMIGMGFTRTWDQLAALRVLLGLLEAGFFPSCVYLLSTWYSRCTSCLTCCLLGSYFAPHHSSKR